MKHLGALLRDEREQAGLTRFDLTRTLGPSENQWYRWEVQGKRMPPVLVLQCMALYDLDPRELLRRAGEEIPAPVAKPAEGGAEVVDHPAWNALDALESAEEAAPPVSPARRRRRRPA